MLARHFRPRVSVVASDVVILTMRGTAGGVDSGTRSKDGVLNRHPGQRREQRQGPADVHAHRLFRMGRAPWDVMDSCEVYDGVDASLCERVDDGIAVAKVNVKHLVGAGTRPAVEYDNIVARLLDASDETLADESKTASYEDARQLVRIADRESGATAGRSNAIISRSSAGRYMPDRILSTFESLLKIGSRLVASRQRWQARTINHVPAPPLPFVDRDSELRDARTRIKQGSPVVAVVGPPGVGKKAVARKVVDDLQRAHRLRRTRRRERYWVKCGYKCPSLGDLCRELATQAGDPSLSAAGSRAKPVALRSFLAHKSRVLLLEDLVLTEDRRSEGLRALFRDLPRQSLVVVSLADLGKAEGARIPLRDLDPSDGRTLIDQEARRTAVRQDVDPSYDAFSQQVLGIVGTNPREIHAFFGELAARPNAHRPDVRGNLLREKAKGDPPRYGDIWMGLSQPDRTILAMCAYLRGHATGALLAEAAGLTEEEAAAALEAFERYKMTVGNEVAHQPTIYQCPPPVERWVLSAQASTIAIARQKLVDHLVRHSREDPRSAIAAIGPLRAVLDDLSDNHHDEEFRRLFEQTFDVLFTRRLLDDRIAYGERAIQTAERLGDHGFASLASEVVSSTYALRDEFEAAEDAVREGRAAAQRAVDSAETPEERAKAAGEIARQQRCQALVLYRRGDAEACLEMLSGAEELARSAGDTESLVNILNLRATASWYQGDFGPSKRAAKKSLDICRDQRVPARWARVEAYPLRDLAEIAMQNKELDEASETLEEAHSRAQEWDDIRQTLRLNLTEARLLLARRKLRRASSKAAVAHREASRIGLAAEARESLALRREARLAMLVFPRRFTYARRRPSRLTDAPVGGD